MEQERYTVKETMERYWEEETRRLGDLPGCKYILVGAVESKRFYAILPN